MPYIVSTLTSNMNYAEHTNLNVSGAYQSVRNVLILGGHGVAQKTDNGGILTQDGVLTKVSDDDLKFLKNNYSFQEHEKNGFIKVLESEPNKAAKTEDMELKDKSAPLTEGDKRLEGSAPKSKVN